MLSPRGVSSMKSKRIRSRCHESFSAMSPVDGGRHCDSCEKTVYDLSRFSLKEAECFFERLQGGACVRANARADGTLLFAIDPKRRLPVYVALGAAVALASGGALASASAQEGDAADATPLQSEEWQGEFVDEDLRHPPPHTPDAGRPDAGPPDAGAPDAGPPDAGPPDAGPRNAAPRH